MGLGSADPNWPKWVALVVARLDDDLVPAVVAGSHHEDAARASAHRPLSPCGLLVAGLALDVLRQWRVVRHHSPFFIILTSTSIAQMQARKRNRLNMSGFDSE